MIPKICRVCGKGFEAKHQATHICGPRCKRLRKNETERQRKFRLKKSRPPLPHPEELPQISCNMCDRAFTPEHKFNKRCRQCAQIIRGGANGGVNNSPGIYGDVWDVKSFGM